MRPSAPGARGRSLQQRCGLAGRRVGPRRAWTVPWHTSPRGTGHARPPARVDGPFPPLTPQQISTSAPGARGRSLDGELGFPGPVVGPRRAWTVPRARSSSGVPSCRPPARVDGPLPPSFSTAAVRSAPGARGRSPARKLKPGGPHVGPRRAWTVPHPSHPIRTASGRPPARVDGPLPPSFSTAAVRSAPGARGRSSTCPECGARIHVGPRRAWTVPPAPRCIYSNSSRPPARVDGPAKFPELNALVASAPGARGRSQAAPQGLTPFCVGPRRAWTVPSAPHPPAQSASRPPARVDGPAVVVGDEPPVASAPGARGRSRSDRACGMTWHVGPRRAWTVPTGIRCSNPSGSRPPARVDGPALSSTAFRSTSSAPGRAWTVPPALTWPRSPSGRPPARVDGPAATLKITYIVWSAPGARGRSLAQTIKGSTKVVGPRRVDGPALTGNARAVLRSAPGARGRSRCSLS